MNEIDKEFYFLRKKLIELQNNRKLPFIYWLFTYKSVFGLKIPLNLILFFFADFFITKPLLGVFFNLPPKTLFFGSLFVNTVVFYAIYYKINNKTFREKEDTLLATIKDKFINKFF